MATVCAEMHHEHRQWLNDSTMWRDDVTLWEKEAQKAADGLRELEDALREHRRAIQTHLDAVAEDEREPKAHEHALAEFERGNLGDDLLGMVKPHQECAEKHAQRLQAHERLKKHHHTVMASWTLLLHAITKKV